MNKQNSRIAALTFAAGLAGMAAFGQAGGAAAGAPAVHDLSVSKFDITTGDAGSLRSDARRIDLKATSLYGLPNVH